MEFISFIQPVAIVAMAIMMFNLYNRVRDLESDLDSLDADLDRDFENLDRDLNEDFADIKSQIAAR
jgi:hypothetical protein